LPFELKSGDSSSQFGRAIANRARYALPSQQNHLPKSIQALWVAAESEADENPKEELHR
jgi:hypothetical protein